MNRDLQNKEDSKNQLGKITFDTCDIFKVQQKRQRQCKI
jgi:hypothetical protein